MRVFQFKVFIISAFGAYLIYQFFTLSISPLPWLDETFMASITDSLIKENTLQIKYAPFLQQDAALLYGPVYFYLQKWVLSFIGFNIFQFRLLNLLCGIACIIALYFWLRKRFSPLLLYFIISCILLEPTFIRNLHSGRMDFVALLFLISAYVCYFKFLDKTNLTWLSVLIGILLALSALTTPRILFGFVFFVVEFFLNFKHLNKLKTLLEIAISFIGIYLLWVFAKFGSITVYLNTYINNPIIKEHIGADRGVVFRYNYLILLALVVIACFIYLYKYKLLLSKFQKMLFRLCCINIIAFHILVAERGPYTALIIPFYCIIIGLAFTVWQQKNYNKKIIIIAQCICLLPFAFIFCIKTIILAMSYKSRSHSDLTEQLAKIIPTKAKVIGCYDYYYACHNNGNPFEEMEYCTDSSKMYHYQKNVFNYEYIVVRDNFSDSKYLMHYLNTSSNILIANIGSNKPMNKFEQMIDALSVIFFDAHLLSSYNGKVYKRCIVIQ